jgi:chemotaxis protein histidine kinase CheA
LPLPLEDLLTKVAAFKAISARKTSGSESANPVSPDSFNTALAKLADDVSRDCQKTVHTSVRMGSVLDLPAHKVNQIRDIAIQLVRNAVVHGIEDATERTVLGKNATGQLQVNLTREESGEWQLSVRDDGAGLDAKRIRQKLIDLSWYSPEQLDSFSDKQIVSHIFKPGFSTASTAGQHAGRGVGLDVVQTHVHNMGARLLLSTVPNQYTDFKVRFSS